MCIRDRYGITEAEVIKLCGKHTVQQIKANEIALLLGMVQSLKDGDTTVDELMNPIRESKEARNSKLADIAAKAAGVKEQPQPEQPANQTQDYANNKPARKSLL